MSNKANKTPSVCLQALNPVRSLLFRFFAVFYRNDKVSFSDYANIAVFAPISNTSRQYPLYVPIEKTKSTGAVLLDQLVTIDYNARQWSYVETVADEFLDELLKKVVVVFQRNKGGLAI